MKKEWTSITLTELEVKMTAGGPNKSSAETEGYTYDWS